MNVIRAFFAIDLDIDVLCVIASAQSAAKRDCAESGWTVKWVPPPSLHVLLCYLGEISVVMPSVLRDELHSFTSESSPVMLQVTGLHVSPPTEEGPREIALNLTTPTHALEPLIEGLRARLEELGFHLADAKIPTRLVIGRVVESGERPLEELLADHTGADFGQCVARHMLLYRSDEHRPRGDFVRLWHLPLDGPDPSVSMTGALAREPDEPEGIPEAKLVEARTLGGSSSVGASDQAASVSDPRDDSVAEEQTDGKAADDEAENA